MSKASIRALAMQLSIAIAMLDNWAKDYDYKFKDDMPLIYLGEIKNMKGHGVFAGHYSGRI